MESHLDHSPGGSVLCTVRLELKGLLLVPLMIAHSGEKWIVTLQSDVPMIYFISEKDSEGSNYIEGRQTTYDKWNWWIQQ